MAMRIALWHVGAATRQIEWCIVDRWFLWSVILPLLRALFEQV